MLNINRTRAWLVFVRFCVCLFVCLFFRFRLFAFCRTLALQHKNRHCWSLKTKQKCSRKNLRSSCKCQDTQQQYRQTQEVRAICQKANTHESQSETRAVSVTPLHYIFIHFQTICVLWQVWIEWTVLLCHAITLHFHIVLCDRCEYSEQYYCVTPLHNYISTLCFVTAVNIVNSTVVSRHYTITFLHCVLWQVWI